MRGSSTVAPGVGAVRGRIVANDVGLFRACSCGRLCRERSEAEQSGSATCHARTRPWGMMVGPCGGGMALSHNIQLCAYLLCACALYECVHICALRWRTASLQLRTSGSCGRSCLVLVCSKSVLLRAHRLAACVVAIWLTRRRMLRAATGGLCRPWCQAGSRSGSRSCALVVCTHAVVCAHARCLGSQLVAAHIVGGIGLFRQFAWPHMGRELCRRYVSPWRRMPRFSWPPLDSPTAEALQSIAIS